MGAEDPPPTTMLPVAVDNDMKGHRVQNLERAEEKEIPAPTPRLFSRTVGDRIYLGRKFTGKYTLGEVAPTDSVVFLSAGVGEAPQDVMTAELLRNGHEGRIISVVCVRYKRDLAYTSQQAMVEKQYPRTRLVQGVRNAFRVAVPPQRRSPSC